MVKGTAMMQNLVRGAHCNVNTADELGVLCRRINRLYEELSRTIDALEKENLYIAEVEKDLKGVRIQAVIHELEGEKIDILRYDPDPRVFIKNALSPAEVTDRDRKSVV